MSKRLTPTIARALAEKVRAVLVKRNVHTAEALRAKVEASKDYKELAKTMTQIIELEKKKTQLKNNLNEKFSTKIADVSINTYSSTPSVSVREHASASTESIKDMILIEDYMSDGSGESAEDLINRIADKLSS